MVLILTGPPGVGKTTVAGLLASRQERAVQVEADRFFYFIRAGLLAPWTPESHEQNQVVMRIVAEAAAGYAGAGYLTVVEGIVDPGWSLDLLRDVFRAADLEIALAVLRAPQAVCAARFQEREGDPDLLDQETLAGIGARFADLGEFERCALDVEGMSPEQTADRLAGLLAEGALRL